jgi:hypothetical protein
MIKKVIKTIKNIKKVFIPKSEFIEEPKKVEKTQPSYVGVPAPVVSPSDSWFPNQVKSDKVVAYEKQVAQKIEEQKIIEAAQPKSIESKNIHEEMYQRASKYWGTWKEELPGGSENFQSGSGGWNSGTGMGQFK